MNNLDQALAHLRQDPKLASLIDTLGVLNYKTQTDYFDALVDTIISQQLSGKAASTIYGRLKNLLPKNLVTPENIVTLSVDNMRGVGISNSKSGYILDAARKVISGHLQLGKIDSWTDEEVTYHLTQVKGIGPWSAQMLLMFSLHRPDILPLNDLGIQNAFTRLYNIKRGNLKKMEKIASAWRPYRTVACWYLWKSLDNQ